MMKEMSIENGMARLTRIALRKPIDRKMTSRTRARPERMLFSRSAIITSISRDLSRTLVTSVPCGQPGCSCLRISSTSLLMVMMFSPERFLIARLTASRPFRREMLLSSL